MKTRKDYMDGKCSHSEYYKQFVSPLVKSWVKDEFTIPVLIHAYNQDPFFNNLPLQCWEALCTINLAAERLKELGDYPSPCSRVCILKEAAKQLVLENTNRN